MGSQAERRLMKALAGCSNKEQIIISGHCPPPNSLQQPPTPHLLPPLLKMLIRTITGSMRKGGVLGPVNTTLIYLQAAWKNIKESEKKECERYGAKIKGDEK